MTKCIPDDDDHHLRHENMEYHIQMELWRGNVAGALQIARQRNEISDFIVAMAPLASHELWELVCTEYAEQLEEDGHYNKAVTYLLAVQKVHQAIDLLRRHRLFKEAVTLTKLRLSPIDPLLEDLYTEWGQNLMKDGQFEQAAKCYLAMRHIQETGKAQYWNHDRSYVKIPNCPRLLSTENQQMLTHAYKIFNQHLIIGEWQEAYKLIEEHESHKILLPLLSTHELLIQQLTALNLSSLKLTQKPMTSEMFSQWEKKEFPKSKIGFPEFLVDKSEIDPVIPWEPFLIGKQTFPHHLLQVWHQHLNVTFVTQELKVMHAFISQLVPHKQNTGDLPNILVLVSIDITLCLLTLLMSETSRAVAHLLQAMSILHKGNHSLLLQVLCRLMLPQGPKYLLKLQQEFNATRVLITMESHGDVNKASGENNNSIKRFLTDIKDDNAISLSGLRCRELDSLRAYYYLAILDFLRDNLPNVQHENDSHDGMPNGKVTNDDQNIIEVNVNQKTSFRGVACKNKADYELANGITFLHRVLPNQDTSKGSIKTGDGDIHSCKDVSSVCQSDKVSFTSGSSALPPFSDQSKIDDSHSSSGICAPKNKDSGGHLTLDDSHGLFNTNDAHFMKPVTLSHELMPLLALPSSRSLLSLSKSLSDSSSVDPLYVPSKLSLLNISPLRRSASSCSPSQTKSANFLPANSLSSFTWPSYSPAFLSPSSNSSLSALSNSPSSLSWASPVLASPSSCSSSASNSSSSSSFKNPGESSRETSECVSKSNKSSSYVRKNTSTSHLTINESHLNYVNLLRLSKGILWDVQAKREALTETLGYIHQAISKHLLNKSSDDTDQYDSGSSVTSARGQLVNSRNNSFPQTTNRHLEEDGGYNTMRLISSSTSQESEESSGASRKVSSSATCENSKYKSFEDLNFKLASLSNSQPLIQDEDVLQRSPVRNVPASYATYKKPSGPCSRLENMIAHKIEQELLGPLATEPATLQKSRKVLWMDGKETWNDTSLGNKSVSQILRLAPDGSAIPVEWDDMPVDIKYSMPYVNLDLLRQEEESIAQELKRVPDVSKIPFPSIRASVERLLHISLMTPYLSTKEKNSYFKQLNDWATLFSVTTKQQQETESLFTNAAREYLTER